MKRRQGLRALRCPSGRVTHCIEITQIVYYYTGSIRIQQRANISGRAIFGFIYDIGHCFAASFRALTLRSVPSRAKLICSRSIVSIHFGKDNNGACANFGSLRGMCNPECIDM